jgi:ribosomal protein S1
VKNPSDVVTVNQKVIVRVVSIDIERKRIALSMKSEAAQPPEKGK